MPSDHQCDMNPKPAQYKIYFSQIYMGWILDSGQTYSVTIIFCPFCGERLA